MLSFIQPMATKRPPICLPPAWTSQLKLWGSVSVTTPEGKVMQSLSVVSISSDHKTYFQPSLL